MSIETQRPLPDVARETGLEPFAPLDWVGMKEIEVPVLLETADGVFRQAAKVDAQVSLDVNPGRGIHMSRLYLLVQQGLGARPLGFSLLRELVEEFIRTHYGHSTSGRLEVRLQWPLRRKALKSGFEAWRTYPVTLAFERRGTENFLTLETTITYSSTCPASAALSRQLIRENFLTQFPQDQVDRESLAMWLGTTQGIIATPHAQRSFARVKVRLSEDAVLNPELLIDRVEEALGTPVQGAVKREDEQEFALRNGQNLMFCEDAARRVKPLLDADPSILSYEAEFNHVESLHPHNAVSFIRG